MPTGTEQPSRRSFLGHAVALAVSASAMDTVWAAPKAFGRLPTPHVLTPRVLTAWNRGDRSWAGLWTPGPTPRGVALPARAHQLLLLPPNAQRPQLQAVVLARRPGVYLLRMDPIRNKALQWHTMEVDRYLAGHAVLAANGRTFFTTETDGDTGQGLVAERDVHTLEKIREFPSGGIGPHALLLEPAGTLLVANGGILNLPETGRRKLNIGTMDSNLTRLDATSGKVMAQYRLEDRFLSLRHLALAADGTIGVALQAEHPDAPERHPAPALALLQGGTLHTVDWAPAQPPPGWDGYAGDVCCAGGRFWVSAPRAGWLANWSAQGDGLRTQALSGASALAAAGGHWLAGGDTSTLLYGPSPTPAQRFILPQKWDNHAALLAF